MRLDARKVIITGAGGWLGTELLESLLAENGPDLLQQSVVCLGSRPRTLTMSDGTALAVHGLDGFQPDPADEVAGIVHLGFLTRDKVALLGFEPYVSANLRITSNAVRLVETVRPDWVATVSSGAVFSDQAGTLENDVERNPYGFTKRIEEELLTSAAAAVGANIAIGRLWGAIGASMPINRAYAVSDFIMQSVESGEIVVRAPHEVFRRYCDARGFMEVLVACAVARKRTSFSSGGHLIELTELAHRIAALTDGTVATRALRPDAAADRYFPQGTEFEDFAAELVCPQRPFEEALAHTVASHLAQARALA